MLRLTTSAAALALLAAIGGSAFAAEPLSEAEYRKALEKCQAADTSQKRDDCLREARDGYEKGVAGQKPAGDTKGAARTVSDKLPDAKPKDGKDLAKGSVNKSVPDKLKQ
jgi:hypothetical protein